MRSKITVQDWSKNGRKGKWAVHYRDEFNKRRRKFFPSKKAAEAEAATMRSQQDAAGEVWLTLPADERHRLMQIHDEAKRLGVDLADLLAEWKRSPRFTGSSPTLEKVISELVSTKTANGRSPRYYESLELLLNQFAKGRERLPIANVGLRDVEGFLDSKNLASRSTLRARLSTLFRFAVRRGYRADNPCDRLEHAKTIKSPTEILTIEQAKKCLEWFEAERSRAFAWFVLTTFGGLRPEEAEKTTWDEINFVEGFIRVEAQTSKVRQRRVVYPRATTLAWLQRAKERGAELPLARQPRRRAIKRLRVLLGFAKWPKDITRHTAASYWLAQTGEAANIAANLGNSEDVLLKHYKALVTKAQAEAFWALVPTAGKTTGQKQKKQSQAKHSTVVPKDVPVPTTAAVSQTVLAA